jgi:hypothetical protein
MLNACKQWRNSNLKNNSRNVEVIPDFCPRPKIVRETARLSNLYIYDRHHSLNGSTRVLVAGKAKPIFNGLVEFNDSCQRIRIPTIENSAREEDCRLNHKDQDHALIT